MDPCSSVIQNFTLSTVLSGPPTNIVVEVLSSTSLRIMWDPPDPFEQNGPIIGYEIVLLVQNGSRVNYDTSSSTFSLQIEGQYTNTTTFINGYFCMHNSVFFFFCLFSDKVWKSIGNTVFQLLQDQHMVSDLTLRLL